MINRSSKYKNRYVHRRDSLSLASLSLDDRDKLARIGVVTRASGDLPEEDEDDEDEEEELEEELEDGDGEAGGRKYGGRDGVEEFDGIGAGSGKVRSGLGLGVEDVVRRWSVMAQLMLPQSWTPGSE